MAAKPLWCALKPFWPLAMTNSTTAATVAATTWVTTYGITSRQENRRATASPTVTAGLKWPPEMCPTAYAIVRTASPKARATPSRPTPTPGKPAASTAVPQPASTSQNVPIASAPRR